MGKVHLCRVQHSAAELQDIFAQFSLYTLPNPAEYFQSKFDKASLVPVLIGMDFLGPQGQGMLIDFNTGLAMFTKTSEPRPPAQQLQMTSKGHYVLNLATYLTGGRESPGHPQVVVRRKATDNPDVDYRFLELGTVYFDMSASDHVMPTMTAVSSDVVSESLANMYWLLDQSRQCVSNVATATSAQMTGPSPTTTPATSPSRSPQGHVEPRRADHQRGNLRGRDQAEDSQGKGQSHATGLHPTGEGGQPRSPCIQRSVAVLQPPRRGLPESQCSRSLDPLLRVQLTPGVHPPSGEPRTDRAEPEPRNGQADVDPAGTSHGEDETYGIHMFGHAAEDRRGGAADAHDQRAKDEPELHDNSSSSDRESGRVLQQQLADDGRHGGHQPRHGVRGRRLPGTAVKTRSFNVPNFIGHKIMQLSAMMTAATSHLLLGLHLQDQDCVWEIACSPHSWLSEACGQHGLPSRRINYQEGFDLYHKETWHRLRELYGTKRPRKLWFSLPCTKWCPWTSVNYNTPERREVLETARRKERRLLWEATSFIKYVLETDEETKIYFEWPHPCVGWKQQPMVNLEKYMDYIGEAWLTCRIDGCNYGMKDEKSGSFIHKKWMIKTNDENFHKNFRAKVCPGNHQHILIEGSLTSQTAYYPWRMVQAIARHWRDQITPPRHVRLLHQQTIEEEQLDDKGSLEQHLRHCELEPANEIEVQDVRDELPGEVTLATLSVSQSAEQFAQAAINAKDTNSRPWKSCL